MKGITSETNLKEFKEIVKKELLDKAFQDFLEDMILTKGFYDFPVSEFYGRGGPAWIALTRILFTDPISAINALAYFHAVSFKVRRGAIIGNGVYFKINRDQDDHKMILGDWVDNYNLTVIPPKK